MKKLLWNEERLKLIMELVNRDFPDNPVPSYARLKRIIRDFEIEMGMSIEQHNKSQNR